MSEKDPTQPDEKPLFDGSGRYIDPRGNELIRDAFVAYEQLRNKLSDFSSELLEDERSLDQKIKEASNYFRKQKIANWPNESLGELEDLIFIQADVDHLGIEIGKILLQHKSHFPAIESIDALSSEGPREK